MIAAAGWGTLGVFLVGLVLNDSYVQGPVLDLLGNDSTEAAANANQYFAYGQSALGGLAAGLIVFVVLRRAGRRAGADLRWPFFLIAGGGAGLLSVISEVLTRTAGAQVLELAGKVSELEQSVQQILSTNRLNSALIVLFVGAFTAMVAVGRTLSPADDEDEDDEIAEASAAGRTDIEDAPIEPKTPAKPADDIPAEPEASAKPVDDVPAEPRTPAKTAASSEDAGQA